MSNDMIITGLSVSEQMNKAKEILVTDVIPKNIEYKKRAELGELSEELKKALKTNEA